MPLDDQQKKQAIILILLVVVLGVVFRVADPFKLFVKNSAINPEANKKIAAQIEKTKQDLKANETGAVTADPKDTTNKTEKPVVNIDINKTSIDYDELIPEVPIYEVVKQFDSKTAYSPDIFVLKGKDIVEGPPGPPLKITSYSTIGNEKQVKIANATAVKSPDKNVFLKKGDEFYFQNVRYRILEITIGYDSETKSQGNVKILDITEGSPTFNREFKKLIKN